jgi:hypothetical protein
LIDFVSLTLEPPSSLKDLPVFLGRNSVIKGTAASRLHVNQQS